MLLSGAAFPRSVCIVDIYIDDLVLTCLSHFSFKTAVEMFERMQAADEFYQGVGCQCHNPRAENARTMT